MDHGAPRLAGKGQWLVCRTDQLVTAGDHVIIIGLVVHADTHSFEPLLYRQRAFGTVTHMRVLAGERQRLSGGDPGVNDSGAIRAGLLTAIRERRAEFEAAGDQAEGERNLPSGAMGTLRELGAFWLKTPAELSRYAAGPARLLRRARGVRLHRRRDRVGGHGR